MNNLKQRAKAWLGKLDDIGGPSCQIEQGAYDMLQEIVGESTYVPLVGGGVGMNADQKKQAVVLLQQHADDVIPHHVLLGDMAALLQELIDAPETEPVAFMYTDNFGTLFTSDKSDFWGAPGIESFAELYTAPPAPSVPDGWRPFLTDVITAAGLLEHGKRDKGLADRIGSFAFDAMRGSTPTPPEPPADLVRDAELLDALEDEVKSRGMFGVSLDYTSHAEDGLIVEKGYRVLMRRFLGPRRATLREAIGAAFDPIERDKQKGGA